MRYLAETLYKCELIVLPNTLNYLIGPEVDLLALPVALATLPRACVEQRVLLVHHETVPFHAILLKHAHIPLHLSHVLKLAKSIVLAVPEFADVLEFIGDSLAEAMQLAVPELTLEDPLLVADVHDTLANGFAIFPLAFVDVA